MTPFGVVRIAPTRTFVLAIVVCSAMASCGPQTITELPDGPYPPGVDRSKDAVGGLEVGNRLMAAAEYELALDAYTRAALESGLTPEILTGMGSANLGLGRLGQSETLLRRALTEAPEWAEAWNNLGVVLMEQGKTTEAQQVFRKAYALDDGQSDSIRDNLRLALAKSETSDTNGAQNEEYKLVRRGSSDFLLSTVP